MTVYVVFADAFDRTERNEDLICTTQAEAKAHSRDLRRMGCEPVTKTFEDETAFYAWKDARR